MHEHANVTNALTLLRADGGMPGESANQSGEMGFGTAEFERRLARNQAMEFSCAIVSIMRPSYRHSH
jgi:hypothetical protein